MLLLSVSVMRTNLGCLRKEGDLALSKQNAPGFSERQETAPLPTRGAAGSLDPEQVGDLAVPSHKGGADICGRRLLAKHLRCKIKQIRQCFKSSVRGRRKVGKSEGNPIILSSVFPQIHGGLRRPAI